MPGQRLDLEPPPFAFDSATIHYAADRPVRPLHVRIEVTLDFAKRAIAGRCITTVKAVREVSVLSFDAVELEVDSCEVSGARVEHDADGQRLNVHLKKPLAAGAEATV